MSELGHDRRHASAFGLEVLLRVLNVGDRMRDVIRIAWREETKRGVRAPKTVREETEIGFAARELRDVCRRSGSRIERVDLTSEAFSERELERDVLAETGAITDPVLPKNAFGNRIPALRTAEEYEVVARVDINCSREAKPVGSIGDLAPGDAGPKRLQHLAHLTRRGAEHGPARLSVRGNHAARLSVRGDHASMLGRHRGGAYGYLISVHPWP